MEGVREQLSGGCAGAAERSRACRNRLEIGGVQELPQPHRVMEDMQEPPSSLPSDGGCAGASFSLAVLWDRVKEPSRSPMWGHSPCTSLRGSCPTHNCPRCPTAGLLSL